MHSDVLRLKQIVLNLMTNAVKFTGAGGSVVVRARRRGADFEITVTDSGIGVPEADRQRIFESFQQGGRGSSREEGTGLGLTLSKRLVSCSVAGCGWRARWRGQHLRLLPAGPGTGGRRAAGRVR